MKRNAGPFDLSSTYVRLRELVVPGYCSVAVYELEHGGILNVRYFSAHDCK